MKTIEATAVLWLHSYYEITMVATIAGVPAGSCSAPHVNDRSRNCSATKSPTI